MFDQNHSETPYPVSQFEEAVAYPLAWHEFVLVMYASLTVGHSLDRRYRASHEQDEILEYSRQKNYNIQICSMVNDYFVEIGKNSENNVIIFSAKYRNGISRLASLLALWLDID